MFTVIILEDFPQHTETMLRLLAQYQREHQDIECDVKTYARAHLLLSEYRRNTDLLLLDIQLPDMLGIDVARKIRSMDDQVMIVFTTSLMQYALDGYEVNAFDYIMKPMVQKPFFAKLDRIFRVLKKRREHVFLEVKTKTDTLRIASEDIAYIEVNNHDLLIHTGEGIVRQWGSLKDCEAQLQAAPFVRCNACYLVNLQYVRGIHGESVQVGEDHLSISRPRRKAFLAAFAQYKGGSR